MNNYSVYWIRKKTHCDEKTEGYIGISNNPQRRFEEHKNSTRYSIVSNAIKKHDGDIVYDILHENITIEEAKNIEKKLRPYKEIGWNIAEGGGMPPNMKGVKRPAHSKRMKGENNPFYGKRHNDEVKMKLSEQKTGKKNHFYGKKRPDHSEKLKKLKGKNYPKFKGYFITPIGKFENYLEACENLKMGKCSLYNYCINQNDRKITKLSRSKNSYLKANFSEEIVGKTYKEIGFGFEYV